MSCECPWYTSSWLTLSRKPLHWSSGELSLLSRLGVKESTTSAHFFVYFNILFCSYSFKSTSNYSISLPDCLLSIKGQAQLCTTSQGVSRSGSCAKKSPGQGSDSLGPLLLPLKPKLYAGAQRDVQPRAAQWPCHP